MDPVSALVLVLVLCAPAAFTAGVFKRARANGHFLPSREHWKQQWDAVRAPSGAGAKVRDAGRKALTGARAVVTKPRQQATSAPPRSRVGVFRRVVVPAGSNGRHVPAQAAPAVAAPAVVPAAQGAPQRPRLTAVPAPVSPPAEPASGGPTMPGTTNGSAAADLMSAVHRVTTEAQAGGIRSKISAHLAMGAGFEQQAAALEQHARALSETGQYPAMVWEPVMQAAGMIRVAAGKMGESGNAVAHIAKTPAGELVGMAPAREELHRA